MVEERIGYRYAKSIFGLAKEKGLLDKVKSDMAMLHSLCENSRDFYLLLKSPLVSAGKKQTILNDIFNGKFESDLTKRLLEIVVRKHREMYLDNIAEAFLRLYDEENRILRGHLVSAYDMESDEIEEIKRIVEQQTGNSFVVETSVDPELIGGFVLHIGDKLFDGSITTSLRRLEQDFKKN